MQGRWRGLWRKARWSVAQRGWKGTLAAAAGGLRRPRLPGRAVSHPFDVQHGTDTGGLLGGGSLASGGKNDAYITAYVGVPPSRLREGIARWQATLPEGERLEDFAFVDLGCGKGRALLVASEHPFREVAGVELNGGLVAIAEANVRQWTAGEKAICPVTVTCGDATEFTLPDGPCLVFLYNPFTAPVVRAVLDALAKRMGGGSPRLDIVFQTEQPETPLRVDDRLQLLWTGTCPLAGEDAVADPVSSPEDVTSLYRWIA